MVGNHRSYWCTRNFTLFPDPIHWMTIGFSRYYITNDYGNSWIEFTEVVPTGLVSFSAPTNYLGYATGSGGLILDMMILLTYQLN